MQKDTILYVIIALLGGFIAGFILANSLNRSEYSAASTVMPTNSTQISSPGGSTPALSPEELKAKVAEADRNPDNFSFQKDLGLSLYRYAAMTQDPELLSEARRVLERARSLNSRDFDVLVGLGNADFDIGFFKKDLASFEKARTTYAKALELQPNDNDVQTDMGISYFVQEPPDYAKAESELKKVTSKDPQHQRSTQFLVQVYAKQKRIPEARAMLEKLRGIDPANPALRELSTLIANAEGSAS
jgi:tetratricopeptide (TPR) repeat protein